MEQLRRAGADVDLAALDTSATPGFDGGRKAGTAALAAGAAELADLQERMFAAATAGDQRRVLLVLQAMDTAGKGGIVSHVVGAVDPQGVHLHAFKAPTEEERSHDFLWRVRRELPGAGILGVFDRSHYEDVLIHRVRGLSSPEVVEERYGLIADFERELVAAGTSIVKVMLHISPGEQRARLAARLDDPSKHWKYNPGDLDERALWDAYMEAYEIAIARTSTDAAPWFVVPADRKWYARLAVQGLLLEALRSLDQQWPPADFDVDAEKARLASS
ncbi:phosphate--nucleotide phosphotransferase [Cellulomonas sp. HZM]|uniref:PPK2 family polyphosphate kinase n=1 Tax=Cellulomonas sp. HZM TaxID=1454010 RepID=UPI00049358F8|nr:phosphate--nucleotide phosphotransferase [Cellulomonas sp. HZM]